MDIDVLSRLLHEEYLAERNYKIIGSANVYGKAMAETDELSKLFEKAIHDKMRAELIVKHYKATGSLKAAENYAAYALSNRYTNNPSI